MVVHVERAVLPGKLRDYIWLYFLNRMAYIV